MPERVPLEYDSGWHERPARDKWLPFTLPPFVLLILALASGLLPSHGAPGTANKIKCSNNLRQLGSAMLSYAGETGHAFPDSLPTLLLRQALDPKLFLCFSSNDSEPSGSGPAEQAAALRKAGHCSYIYVGCGLTDACNFDCVVAFEDPANHRMRGGNVLYADAHVSFEPLPDIVQLVAELEAGRNPPRISPLSEKQAKSLYDKTWKSKLPSMLSGTWGASLPQPTTQSAPER